MISDDIRTAARWAEEAVERGGATGAECERLAQVLDALADDQEATEQALLVAQHQGGAAQPVFAPCVGPPDPPPPGGARIIPFPVVSPGPRTPRPGGAA